MTSPRGVIERATCRISPDDVIAGIDQAIIGEVAGVADDELHAVREIIHAPVVTVGASHVVERAANAITGGDDRESSPDRRRISAAAKVDQRDGECALSCDVAVD
jgi:hypothetical protein